ncbi:MAG: hypothetical protein ACK5EA_08375 [Planctomycetaceae bacterium]
MSLSSTRSPNMFRHSLCEQCGYMREIVSGKGSRFLMCQRATGGAALPKYPPQPVLVCAGFESRQVRDAGPADGNESGAAGG